MPNVARNDDFSPPLIGDHNWLEHVGPAVVDGERKAKGLIPRNYATDPQGCYASAPAAVDMPLIDPSEWEKLIADMDRDESQIRHFILRGDGGRAYPSLDQNGQGYCAVAGTPVRMADGTLKPIERVALGDEVLTNSLRPRRVSQTHQRLFSGDLIRLWADGVEGSVTVTEDHPIPTPNRRGSGFYDSQARHWQPGDTLYALREGELRETAVARVERERASGLTVYDIGVDEEHYFLAGPGGILVHNCWAYSTTGCVMALRAIHNEPYVRLSAHAVACKIKGFRDEGGWGALSLDFIQKNGVPSVQYWAEKSMSRSHDNEATWANAKLHRVTEGWVDLAASVYSRNLSWAQVVTCLLCRTPVVTDFNWWGHSVFAAYLASGRSHRRKTRGATGKLLQLKDFDLAWGMNNPETRGLGLGIRNSWTDSYGDRGFATLTGSRAVPDGAVAPRVTTPSAA